MAWCYSLRFDLHSRCEAVTNMYIQELLACTAPACCHNNRAVSLLLTLLCFMMSRDCGVTQKRECQAIYQASLTFCSLGQTYIQTPECQRVLVQPLVSTSRVWGASLSAVMIAEAYGRQQESLAYFGFNRAREHSKRHCSTASGRTITGSADCSHCCSHRAAKQHDDHACPFH